MKIALNIENFSVSKGGGEGYANNFAYQLFKNGHEVHIFSSLLKDIPEYINPHNVTIIRSPKFMRVLSFPYESEKLLRKMKFDIIIGFGGTWFADIYRPGGGTERGWFIQNLKSIDNSFLRGLNTIIRSISPTNLAGFYVDRRVYKSRKLKLVIANSNMVKKDIIKFHGLPEDMIKVVYNGVDLDKFTPNNKEKFREKTRNLYNIDNQEIVMLFIANNFRLKGLHCLIKAVSILKTNTNERFRLIVAGRGNALKYMKLAEKSGCARNIIFAGQVKKPERLFAASDIFVHPTFYDPFANVCLEALASGLPVITTKYNGAGELITDCEEGFVIDDPYEISIMADRIAYYFSESRRIEAGKKARKRAELFPWEKNYSEILNAVGDVNE